MSEIEEARVKAEQKLAGKRAPSDALEKRCEAITGDVLDRVMKEFPKTADEKLVLDDEEAAQCVLTSMTVVAATLLASIGVDPAIFATRVIQSTIAISEAIVAEKK